MKPSINVFSNPVLERLTYTSIFPVIIVFTLIFFIMLYLSIDIPLATAFLLFLIGVFSWTLTEYLIHRFIFHSHFFQTKMTRFYLIMHGIHHETPLDKNRLLVPLYVSLPLGTLFYMVFYLMLGHYANALFCGFILGYLTYDMTHYRIHHFQPTSWLAKQLRAYHFKHHFKDYTRNFGVSSPLWDVILQSKIKDQAGT